MHTRFNVWMLIATASLIVTAVMAAPAAAEDPQEEACKDDTGQPLGPGIKNVNIALTNTTVGEATGVKGDGALLCGSDFGDLDDPTDLDNMKGFIAGKIEMPFAHSKATGYVSSLETRCANPVKNPGCENINEDGSKSGNLEEGRYMGATAASVMGTGAIMGKISLEDIPLNIYVHEAPGVGVPNTHCTADAVACFQAVDSIGVGVSDIIIKVEQEPVSVVKRSRMIGYQPVSTIGSIDTIYLTKIGPLDLCTYAGEVGAEECGTDPDDWANKVGPVATWHTCSPEAWSIMHLTFGGDQEKWTGGWGFNVSAASNMNIKGINWWWGKDPSWWGIGAKIKEDWDRYRAELQEYYKGRRHEKPETPPSWKKNGPGEAYEGITPTKVTDDYYGNNLKNPFCSEVTTTKADGTSDGLQEPAWSKEGPDGAGRPDGSAGSDARDSSQDWDSKDSSQSSFDSRSGADSKSSNEKSKHRRSGHRRFSNG